MKRSANLWVGFRAGGLLAHAWNDQVKCWYYPAFATHDQASAFWRKQPDRAWAIGEVNLTSVWAIGEVNLTSASSGGSAGDPRDVKPRARKET